MLAAEPWSLPERRGQGQRLELPVKLQLPGRQLPRFLGDVKRVDDDPRVGELGCDIADPGCGPAAKGAGKTTQLDVEIFAGVNVWVWLPPSRLHRVEESRNARPELLKAEPWNRPGVGVQHE